MANELLIIPESQLADVIKVIRAGLANTLQADMPAEVREQLAKWCYDEEAYLRRQAGE